MTRLMHLSAICLFFALFGTVAKAQQPPVIDSIYFHLYTDSLKKAVYNYINVDARMSNGSWRPLTGKDLLLDASYGKWDDNNLIIDTSFKGAYVEVKATLKARPELTRSIRIYIKTLPDPPLKTEAELKRKW